jgi:hypothetical protein
MKKISIFLFTAVLMISFAACNGAKKTDAPAEVIESAPVEEVKAPEATPVVELTPAEALKAFQDFAKEYAEANNNISKDPQKFMKLAGQAQQKVADIERLKIDFNAKQLKEYQKAIEIITKVNQGGKK